MSDAPTDDRTVTVRRDRRPIMSTSAIISGVVGIVWLIEPGAFNGVLGVTAATGWLYVAVAVALLVAVALDRIPPR